MFLALYILNVHDAFPIKSVESKRRHRDAVGILGLKFMRLAYDTGFAPNFLVMLENRELFDSMSLEEVDSARYLFASGGEEHAQEKALHVAYRESPS